MEEVAVNSKVEEEGMEQTVVSAMVVVVEVAPGIFGPLPQVMGVQVQGSTVAQEHMGMSGGEAMVEVSHNF